MRLRELLDALGRDALVRLLRDGQLGGSRTNDQRRAVLARTYRDNPETLLARLTRDELIDVFNEVVFDTDGTATHLPRPERYTGPKLVDLALAAFVRAENRDEFAPWNEVEEENADEDEDEDEDRDESQLYDEPTPAHPFRNLTKEWSRPRKITTVLRRLGMDVPQRLRKSRFQEALRELRELGIEAAHPDGAEVGMDEDSPGIASKLRLRLSPATPTHQSTVAVPGPDSDEDEDEDEIEEARRPAHEILSQEARSFLAAADPGIGWPVNGVVRAGTLDVPVAVYVRRVGRTSRKRAVERRFQNPAQVHARAIVEPEDGYCLLLGVWDEQGPDRVVLVALDAYRRLNRSTRFSLFMPLSLLEEAADTGSAEHRSASGELLRAFRPEALPDYVESLLREMPLTGITQSPKPIHVADSARIVIAPPSDPTLHDDGSVHIRPRVGMYSAFARLNYKPWFAIAEFVDNSIQSFLDHEDKLREELGGPLVVDIELDEDEIRITDRAGGISAADFPRAFSPSQPPPDVTGLSEFGLGMKAAACWFSRNWSVRTSALGEPVARTIEFDVPQISRQGIERLPVTPSGAREGDHYTVVSLRNLRVRPRGRTISKIRDHLTGIYRVLMREDIVRIRLTRPGEGMVELKWEQPEFLVAPDYRHPERPPVTWKKDFDFEVGERHVSGWAGLLAQGKQSRAGFAVFRRKRLIQGSGDEAYRPKAIFGTRNSYRQQRLVGEIFVDGFDVSHTKDGIQWGGDEDDMLAILRRELDGGDLPLLRQADGYRSRKLANQLENGFGKEAVASTRDVINSSTTERVLTELLAPTSASELEDEASFLDAPSRPERTLSAGTSLLRLQHDGRPWTISLEVIEDAAREDWFGSHLAEGKEDDRLSVWLNTAHPFSERFLNESEEFVTPALRIVAALALAEHTARASGVRSAGQIRKRMNQLLREAISQSSTERSK